MTEELCNCKNFPGPRYCWPEKNTISPSSPSSLSHHLTILTVCQTRSVVHTWHLYVATFCSSGFNLRPLQAPSSPTQWEEGSNLHSVVVVKLGEYIVKMEGNDWYVYTIMGFVHLHTFLLVPPYAWSTQKICLMAFPETIQLYISLGSGLSSRFF